MATLPAMSSLRREIGLAGAVLLGLGSMVGTGVFVSIGMAAGVAGWGLLAAIALAALLAMANALSSAQLAAAHPVSGGTYEYGRRYLSPALGFAAGWTFLCAKSASAATAALGAAAYGASLASRVDGGGETGGVGSGTGDAAVWIARGLALLIVIGLTLLVAGGIRRSNRANAVIVSVTLLSLGALVLAVALAGAGERADTARASITAPFGAPSWPALLEATALMFVAFTGYGRLATLGEEVRDPRRVIPRAIVCTMIIVTSLYLVVAWASLRAIGPQALGEAVASRAAPLEAVARAVGPAWLGALVAVGAVTAMLGVLLNLILGLSRVVLAMARHGDAPAPLARISEHRASPVLAVLVCGAAIAALAIVGSVRFSWSLSAFTVLLYYAITNAAALRLPPPDRRFPRAIAWAGLIACLGLAFWVEWRAWVVGLALLVVGFALRAILRRCGLTASPGADGIPSP